MPELIDICGPDGIRNFFNRAQHNLDQEFAALEGPIGMWDGRVKNLGPFPNASGFAARVTTLGFNRPRTTAIRFQPMVGLQDNCAVSCDTPAQEVNLGNWDNLWYRMTQYAENTEVFCLVSMWGDALNLTEQLENHIRNLKDRTASIMDEFKRSNYAAVAFNKWIGAEGFSAPRRQLWQFATDADGQPDVNFIILDPSIDPTDVSLPTIPQLNYIIETGSYYTGTFPNGNAEFITDFETRQELPKFDTNTRADNRFRDPSSLDPALGVNGPNGEVGRSGMGRTLSYADIDFVRDPFAMRYRWTLDEPAYPNGVLKRIEQWSAQQVTGGCWDEISQEYMEGDFQVSLFYNDNVIGMQDMNLPTNLPGGTYSQPQSPYNGMWRFVNEINEITPCNVDRNKAFWRMVMRMAAKPIRSGRMGHLYLHRRFGTRGPVKSCRPLQVAGSYFTCDESCPPFDFFPPPLTDPVVCGTWNSDAITGCATPQ